MLFENSRIEKQAKLENIFEDMKEKREIIIKYLHMAIVSALNS